MRIAIIHDYITSFGGAEKTFKNLLKLFPQAEAYALFYDRKIKERFFPDIKIKTSFLQKAPFKHKYQLLMPLMPVAAETLDFRDFDIVISSSFSFAKGIITRPQTKHICYCYSPNRYLWIRENNSGFLWKNPVSKILLHHMRIWDRQASERVDEFIAISRTVQARIKKYYKRTSKLIYPPVQIPDAVEQVNKQTNSKKEFYLIVSQLRKYKRIDLAVKAFNKLGLTLIIIGQGPKRKKLQKIAKKNIKFLGWQPDKVISKYYKDCTGFVFPGEDDFGIAPVEAMGYGKPILAYRKGGATETIIEGKTGEFFDVQHPAVLADGMRRLKNNLQNYNPRFISNHAKNFSQQRFEKEFKNLILK